MRFVWLMMLMVLGGMSPLLAEDKPSKQSPKILPCGHPVFRAMDFMIGDWQVFHTQSNKLAAFDRITRTLKGCAYQQSWISLDDHFSSAHVPFRMSGKSLTSFNGSKWIQFWVDNQAGSQILTGAPDGNQFVLRSEEPVGGYYFELSWKPLKNREIHHINRRRTGPDAPWEVVADMLYRKNINRLGLEPITN